MAKRKFHLAEGVNSVAFMVPGRSETVMFDGDFETDDEALIAMAEQNEHVKQGASPKEEPKSAPKDKDE